MSTRPKHRGREPGHPKQKLVDEHPLLRHFLSPLELAAYQHEFEPFVYVIEGVPLHIDAAMCRLLFKRCREQARVMRGLLG